MNATDRTDEQAEGLRNYLDNDSRLFNSATFAVRHLRNAFDNSAKQLAKESADYADDPCHPLYAERHLPASEQFPREARDLAIREFVEYWLNELNIQEGGQQ